MKVFDRYVFVEFVSVLTVATIAIAGVFFGTVEFRKLMEYVSTFGVPFKTILLVDILQIPTLVMFALPAGVLAGAMILMIRQHHDSEIMVLQVSGVSLWRIMRPYLLIGLLATGLSFVIVEIAPKARHLSAQLMLAGFAHSDRPFPAKLAVDFRDEKDRLLNLMIFGRAQGKATEGLVVLDFSRDKMVQLLWSSVAQWKDGSWTLQSGRAFELLLPDDDGVRGSFGTMTLNGVASAMDALAAMPSSSLDKSRKQITDEIEQWKKKGKAVPPELLIQYYRRFSQPLSCFLLVIAGSPIALIRKRRDAGFGLAYGGVVIVAYFLLLQICISLGANGRMDPVLAAWLPGTSLATLGLLLAIRRF